MSIDGGLPDGVNAWNLPGESAIEIERSDFLQAYRPSVEQIALEELTTECHRRGTAIRPEFLDYNISHPRLDAKSFVLMLKRIGAETWTDRIHAIVASLTSGPEAA